MKSSYHPMSSPWNHTEVQDPINPEPQTRNPIVIPLLYFKGMSPGMRLMMFQLSSFCCTPKLLNRKPRGCYAEAFAGLLSNQGEKSIDLYFIMVPLRKNV